MQFHEFWSWWDFHKTKLVQFGREKAYSMQAEALKERHARGEYGNPNADPAKRRLLHVAQMHITQNEANWHKNRRPYYKVYPCVVDTLCKLKLEFNCPCPKVPEGAICIRFAEGHEPKITDGNRIKALLVHSGMFSVEMKDGTEELKEMLYIQVTLKENQFGGAGGQDYYWFYFDTNSGMTIEKCLQQPNTFMMPDGYEAKIGRSNTTVPKHYEVRVLATRIALTTCMLKDDPEIITRDVLNKQQDKYDSEKNESRKTGMEDKAKRNGVFGWSIGKNIEVTPHFRRPHWGLRYTGPNGSIPQIVPVKGCKVNGNKLTTAPNGHMLEDGTEIEHGQAVAS